MIILLRFVSKMNFILIFMLTILDQSKGQIDGGFWWLEYQQNKTTNPPSTLRTNPTTTTIETSTIDGEPICCECVKFYLCKNGVIDTSGSGLMDIRHFAEPVINVETCPDPLDVCCKPPDTPSSCDDDYNPDFLDPETPCTCVIWEFCPEELIVSNGKGVTNITLQSGLEVSHSSCNHALHVCCALHLLDESTTSKSTTPEQAKPTTSEPITPKPTTTGLDCECVPYHLCDQEGYIITGGAGLIDIRTSHSYDTIPICPSDPKQLCCKLRKNDETTLLTSTTKENTNVISTTTVTTYATKTKTPIYSNTTITQLLTSPPTTVPPSSNKTCGIRNSNGIQVRITGFKDGQAQFGEYPWVVMLLRREQIMTKKHLLFVGGGTLIHPRVVLTAAHRVDQPEGEKKNEYVVRIGEWDARTDHEPGQHQDIEIEQVIVHPSFNKQALWYNFALLILKEEVKIQDHISTICIPKNMSYISTEGCIINGWGKDAFDEGVYQTIMKSLQLPLVPHGRCEGMLRKTRLSRYFRLHPSFICAGGKAGEDACRGDGGGPLACPVIGKPGQYRLVGITSWGIGCGEEGIPGVYADAVKNRDWIMENVHSLFPTVAPTTTTIATTKAFTTLPRIPRIQNFTTTMESLESEEYEDYSSEIDDLLNPDGTDVVVGDEVFDDIKAKKKRKERRKQRKNRRRQRRKQIKRLKKLQQQRRMK